jgi:hypothetical protein
MSCDKSRRTVVFFNPDGSDERSLHIRRFYFSLHHVMRSVTRSTSFCDLVSLSVLAERGSESLPLAFLETALTEKDGFALSFWMVDLGDIRRASFLLCELVQPVAASFLMRWRVQAFRVC